MRRFPVLSRFLVALGFVAAQALALVHATSHELKPDSGNTCEVCALAHAAGAAPMVAQASAIDVPRGNGPILPAVAAIPARPLARPHSRGPPPVLA